MSQLNELSRKTLGKKYTEEFYVDKHDGSHHVFHSETGKSHTSFSDKHEAENYAKEMNKTSKSLEEGGAMHEDFVPIADVITLVANDQHGEATAVVNDLLSSRILGALQTQKQVVAQNLFPSESYEQLEETEQLNETKTIGNPQLHQSILHQVPIKKLDTTRSVLKSTGIKHRIRWRGPRGTNNHDTPKANATSFSVYKRREEEEE